MSCPQCRSGRNDSPAGTKTDAGGTLPAQGGASAQGGRPGGTLAAQPQRPLFRRIAGKTSWLIPGITLALIPKCPLCLAAYISLATGVSLPFATAAWLRTSLIVLSTVALVALLIKAYAPKIKKTDICNHNPPI